jgi:hypothetical protein
VWRADVTLAGTALHVPIYVDRVTSGPEATFAAAKLQLCLAGPVGTPQGAQLFDAEFDVTGVFTNPVVKPRPLVWHAAFTPYLGATGTPNPAGTTEGQAWIPLTMKLTLEVKRLKHGVVLLRGRLLAEDRAIVGPSVDLYAGNKKVGKAKLTRQGFSVRKRIKRKTRFQVRIAAIGVFDTCIAPPIGTPQGCQSATLRLLAQSKAVLVKPKR